MKNNQLAIKEGLRLPIISSYRGLNPYVARDTFANALINAKLKYPNEPEWSELEALEFFNIWEQSIMDNKGCSQLAFNRTFLIFRSHNADFFKRQTAHK